MTTHIQFNGKPVERPDAPRVGVIGCGSHSFRNIYPVFRFVPVELAAVCDLDLGKARAFAEKFGARTAYDDHRKMLAQENLDAVFLIVGYDANGRPLYPSIAADCLAAGCHVWMEKPPAASVAEIVMLEKLSAQHGRHVMTGFKKMFFPAHEKAKELMDAPEFGNLSLVLLEYPQYIPTLGEMREYAERKSVWPVCGFLDHLCHPVSLMLYWCGMPESMFYSRSTSGGGVVHFQFANGAVASLALTCRAASDGGLEHSKIISDSRRHIEVHNNNRVIYRRNPPNLAYGASPSYYSGAPGEVSAIWEPEYSLGVLYNTGLFQLGYYGEISEFVNSLIERRPPCKATLEHARQLTLIFEKFIEGPNRLISLD